MRRRQIAQQRLQALAPVARPTVPVIAPVVAQTIPQAVVQQDPGPKKRRTAAADRVRRMRERRRENVVVVEHHYSTSSTYTLMKCGFLPESVDDLPNDAAGNRQRKALYQDAFAKMLRHLGAEIEKREQAQAERIFRRKLGGCNT